MRWLFAALLIIVAAVAAQGELITHSVGGGSLTGGGTAVTGCLDTQVLFDNAGKLGCDAGLTKAAGATGAVGVGGVLTQGGAILIGGANGSIQIPNNGTYIWGNGSKITSTGSGLFQFQNNGNSANFTVNTAGSTGGPLATAAISSNGTQPTLTGTCAVVAGTRVGGATAGSFAIPAGNCVAGTTVIVGIVPTAVNGYACDAHDLTTPTSIFDQTTTGANSITFTIRSVTANAADVVTWKCMAY